MHTTTVTVYEDDSDLPGTYYCHHNGDFSGDVFIMTPDPERPQEALLYAKIPYKILETLVAAKVRSDLIGAIESMDDHGILTNFAL